MLTAVRSRAAQSLRRAVATRALTHLTSSSSAFALSAPRFSPSAASSTAVRCFASQSVPVPPMGDSISEGTLAEVLTQVGQSVNVDDVVAKLDTDKVSVDIRSPVAGAISKWHGKIGDNMKVGAPLFDVEVGASGSASSAAPAAPASSSNIQQQGAVQSTAQLPNADVGEKKKAPLAQSGLQPATSIHPTDPQGAPHRVPSIHFRFGKRDPTPARGAGHQHQNNQTAPVGGADFLTANEAAARAWESLPARYKRKPLKETLLVTIELGGAANYESKKKQKA